MPYRRRNRNGERESVAHAIHNVSMRSAFPFVRVNCSAIPENLMRSEFFGYEEGSFTGGLKGGKAGKFEKAHLGSMFLDEVNAMSLSMQPKLLRALQEKEIERISGAEREHTCKCSCHSRIKYAAGHAGGRRKVPPRSFLQAEYNDNKNTAAPRA